MPNSSPIVRLPLLFGAPLPAMLAGARRIAADGLRRFRRACVRRATRARLTALDDRALKDIGLQRGEIDSVVAALSDGRRSRYR